MKKQKKSKSKGHSAKNYQLQDAISLHRKGQYSSAIPIYEHLLEKNPDHSECAYLSALAMYQAGESAKALERCQDAIRIKDDKPDYHNLLGQIYLEGRMFEDAVNSFKKVLMLLPEAKGVHNTLGLAYQGMRDFENAEKSFEKELEINATDPNPFNNLGLLCRDKGEFEQAITFFEKALSVSPGFYIAMNNMGQVLLSRGRIHDAIGFFERALTLMPGFYEGLLNLSVAQFRLGRLDEAIMSGNKAKKINPSSIDVYTHLVIVSLSSGDFTKAESYVDEAIAIHPDNAELFFLKGLINHEKNDLENAAKYYNQCLSLNPKHSGAFNNSGNLFKKMHLAADAEWCYLKAIEYNPDYAEAYSNLGVLYMELNDLGKALECYDKAIDLKLENPNVFLSKGVLYQKAGDMEKAAANFHRALELNSNLPGAYYHLGEIARSSSDYEKAISYYEEALDRAPEYAVACDQLAYVLQRVCDWDKAQVRIGQMMALTQKTLEAGADIDETAHHCLSRSDDPERAFVIARAWSETIAKRVSALSSEYTHERKTKDKITIGYFSNTFRNHPGGHLIAGLFQHHDRDRFRVICYSYGEDDQSYYRKKVEADSDVFRDVRSLDDKSTADMIYHDGVDILVDLRGQTAGHRMGVCAMRPAPIQVVYLGFAGTSGADFFDYIIADKTTIHDGDQSYYSEKIVFMPDCYQVNNNEQAISDDLFERKDLGLPEEGFVFCSFNTAYKIEPVMFGCWAGILKQVPGSVLWLLKDSDLMAENLRRAIESLGLSRDRLVFAEKTSKEKHLKRTQLADLALDTRIYTGHTTTSDSLWAGVPVITMPGRHFASRVSASILKAAGIPELVVNDLESYRELAVKLAGDRDMLQMLKQKVQDARHTQPLFNTGLFVSQIEKAYDIMSKRFVSGGPAADIVL